MVLFGKSKKEREKEYMNRLDVPLCLKEDFELIIDDVFIKYPLCNLLGRSRFRSRFFSFCLQDSRYTAPLRLPYRS